MWYGVKNIKWKNKIKNLKLRNKLATRSLSISLSLKPNLNFNKMVFHIPFFWDALLLKILNKKNHIICYMYSNLYFFFMPILINLNKYFLDINTRVFWINNLYKNNFFGLYWNIFKNIFFSFVKIFFKKLKFKGKGYYIYKNYRNTIATQLGHSHASLLYNFNVGLKFISKTVIILYGINKNDILKKGKSFYFKKPINIFTGRGIRFSKQIIYKKTGKISSYR